MKTLVVAEHNNSELSAATLSVVEAAKKLEKDIDILVAGDSANAVLEQAKSVEGVSSSFSFNDARFTNEIAEDLAECIVSVAEDYSYFLSEF